MTEKTLYILRGVSGSGKTTLADTLEQSLPNCTSVSADDFWVARNGTYNFDVKLLPVAHKTCSDIVLSNMVDFVENIILHNTNTSEDEIRPYMKLAKAFDYKVVSLIVENRHGNTNIHDVPEKTLLRQESKLRNSIKLR